MNLFGHRFGHPIVGKANLPGEPANPWVYVDTGEPVASSEARACPKCRLLPTAEGHDPCIAHLPGVQNACCGHGAHEGYVHFTNGVVIRGAFEFDE